MRKLRALLPLALLAAAVAPEPAAAQGGQCPVLGTGSTLYADYATSAVQFRDQLFARPGLNVAMAGTSAPPRFRAAGANIVYWEENLPQLVGTPGSPAPSSSVQGAASELLSEAQTTTGCPNPVVALNELQPSGSAASNVQYRNNIIALMSALAAGGAQPALLVAPSQTSNPASKGTFFPQAAQFGAIVLELYFNNKALYPQGPLLSSRSIRLTFRQRLAAFTALGIQPQRLGIMLGFQSGTGQQGREGLQPLAAWLEMVKLNTLAARAVNRDVPVASIWSWGWGTFGNVGSADPDKPTAACVYLWTRSPSLCNAPAQAQFDTSTTEGQILLGASTQCAWKPGGRIRVADVKRLGPVLANNLGQTLTALWELALARRQAKVPGRSITRAQAQIVTRRYDGSTSRYRRALRRKKLSRALARRIIADQLARQIITRRGQRKRPKQTFAQWLASAESTANQSLTCQQDQIPPTGDLNLAQRLPFLKIPSQSRQRSGSGNGS